MWRMRNNNLEIRMAGSSCRPQQHSSKSAVKQYGAQSVFG